jgi:LPXTG-site transpeptidase (sortase) family protein
VLAFGATARACDPLGTADQGSSSGGVIAASPPSGFTARGEAASASTSNSTANPGSGAVDQTTSASPPSLLDPATAPALGLPAAAKPVPSGELVSFRVLRGTTVLIDARSSGLAHYGTSPSCEVPGQPCYDAPFLDKVARIDVGAPPEVPGTQTTFITGHSNRYRPDDAARGVFSHLQDVRVGDQLVLTTTAGVFTYRVTKAFSVPFDQLTTNPDVVTVRKDTVVAISCVISPDQRSYVGNYVVVAALAGSNPI